MTPHTLLDAIHSFGAGMAGGILLLTILFSVMFPGARHPGRPTEEE